MFGCHAAQSGSSLSAVNDNRTGRAPFRPIAGTIMASVRLLYDDRGRAVFFGRRQTGAFRCRVELLAARIIEAFRLRKPTNGSSGSYELQRNILYSADS
jgi:hypothetical protein